MLSSYEYLFVSVELKKILSYNQVFFRFILSFLITTTF